MNIDGNFNKLQYIIKLNFNSHHKIEKETLDHRQSLLKACGNIIP
jgi:DnaJ-domain-containing protein 1